MKIRKFLLSLLCVGAVSAYAVPAKMGVVRSYIQPDGTEINLSLVGDENNHHYMTQDNQIVIGSEGRYCYATVDKNGALINSNILAHEVDMRTAEELSLLKSINTHVLKSAIATKAPALAPEMPSVDGMGLFPDSKFPTKGKVKALVFLVEYNDVKFQTEDASEYFHSMINDDNFNQRGGTGSAREYYLDNSDGMFEPIFDVYGPITLPQDRKYYGGNNSAGNDRNPQYMLIHAAQRLDDEVDFSQYDTDGDGYVDNVFIFYAGESEATGGGEDCVWPHAWQYSFNISMDGVKFSRYACSSEMISPTDVDGVGTFVHEFGHVLGLPDLYNTVDGSVTYTPAIWSCMDQGCYNNNSRTPPCLSSFERNALGWMGDNLVEITGPASCTLAPLYDSNKAYVIRTNRAHEFFVFENRQQFGWDKYLPYHGMLIWHIDYNESKWRNNVVNNKEDHQYVDLVEASNKTFGTVTNMRKYPFPGTLKVTEFKYGGEPSFQSWMGDNLNLDITKIRESFNIITFDVAGGGSDPASIADVKLGEVSHSVVGRSISVESEGNISVCDMMGRVVAKGSDTLVTRELTPGIYIISAGSSTAKVIVK